jgi:hypothetical protein
MVRLLGFKQVRKPKTLIHFATGGIAHFLNLLGNSINFCRESGLKLVVSSEYHQPLGRLQLDQIFQLEAPFDAYQSIPSHIQKSFGDLRPIRFERENIGLVSMVSSLDATRLFAGYLPSQDFAGKFAPTTGDWVPGLVQERLKMLPDSLLTAVDSLSLRGGFQEAVLRRENSLGGPFIGVHFRNTDYFNDINDTISRVSDTIERTGIESVYWCTDDSSSIDEAKERLPGVHIQHKQDFDSAGMTNLHYGLSGEQSINHLQNTFADLFTLSIADEHIPSAQSSWRRLVPLLRAEKEMAQKFFGLNS